MCFFLNNNTLFFLDEKRETLQTKHLSLCLVIYIKTLCCAFVRRAFAETNKEREREKKNASSCTHTHTLSLSEEEEEEEKAALLCLRVLKASF